MMDKNTKNKPYINQDWLYWAVNKTYDFVAGKVFCEEDCKKAVTNIILSMCDTFGVEYERDYFVENIHEAFEKRYHKNRLPNRYNYWFDTGQTKIDVSSAEIVVHGTVDKPYYEIKYYTLDGEGHIGYSSYDLKNVFEWLEECFKVVDTENNKTQ